MLSATCLIMFKNSYLNFQITGLNHIIVQGCEQIHYIFPVINIATFLSNYNVLNALLNPSYVFFYLTQKKKRNCSQSDIESTVLQRRNVRKRRQVTCSILHSLITYFCEIYFLISKPKGLCSTFN